MDLKSHLKGKKVIVRNTFMSKRAKTVKDEASDVVFTYTILNMFHSNHNQIDCPTEQIDHSDVLESTKLLVSTLRAKL